jgi:hypothetical protein
VITREFTYIPHVRHNVVSRSFAGLLSLWLAICMVEPAQLHTCAMHGALAIQTSGADAHVNPAAHQVATHQPAHSDHSHHTDSQSRQCSCLGDCNAAGARVGLPATIVSLQAIAGIYESEPQFDSGSAVVSAGNRLLPFANGPPPNSSRA